MITFIYISKNDFGYVLVLEVLLSVLILDDDIRPDSLKDQKLAMEAICISMAPFELSLLRYRL